MIFDPIQLGVGAEERRIIPGILWKIYPETMVAESVAAKIFKIGSVVFEIWPFYHITLWDAFVSITENEHDKTPYSESMERPNCLMAL